MTDLNWVAPAVQLGLAAGLVLFLVTYSNPKERREWQAFMLQALKEMADRHEKWQKENNENWSRLVGVITDARFQILSEVKNVLTDNTNITKAVLERVNNVFDDVVRGVLH